MDGVRRPGRLRLSAVPNARSLGDARDAVPRSARSRVRALTAMREAAGPRSCRQAWRRGGWRWGGGSALRLIPWCRVCGFCMSARARTERLGRPNRAKAGRARPFPVRRCHPGFEPARARTERLGRALSKRCRALSSSIGQRPSPSRSATTGEGPGTGPAGPPRARKRRCAAVVPQGAAAQGSWAQRAEDCSGERRRVEGVARQRRTDIGEGFAGRAAATSCPEAERRETAIRVAR